MGLEKGIAEGKRMKEEECCLTFLPLAWLWLFLVGSNFCSSVIDENGEGGWVARKKGFLLPLMGRGLNDFLFIIYTNLYSYILYTLFCILYVLYMFSKKRKIINIVTEIWSNV